MPLRLVARVVGDRRDEFLPLSITDSCRVSGAPRTALLSDLILRGDDFTCDFDGFRISVSSSSGRFREDFLALASALLLVLLALLALLALRTAPTAPLAPLVCNGGARVSSFSDSLALAFLSNVFGFEAGDFCIFAFPFVFTSLLLDAFVGAAIDEEFLPYTYLPLSDPVDTALPDPQPDHPSLAFLGLFENIVHASMLFIRLNANGSSSNRLVELIEFWCCRGAPGIPLVCPPPCEKLFFALPEAELACGVGYAMAFAAASKENLCSNSAPKPALPAS
jgi:hypothetical protein